MTRPLIIIGTSGNAGDLLDIVEAINADRPTWDVVGFLDDSRAPSSRHLEREVLGPVARAVEFSDSYFVNAIGSDRSFRRRAEIVERSAVPTDRFATLVHPGASVSRRARLGCGTYVNFGATIAGAVGVGNHVGIGPGCIVGHDAVIEDYAMLAPGCVVSGAARIGRLGYIGAAACVRQCVCVGAGALVGMGAVVLHHVESNSTVVGNPARLLLAREVSRDTR